MHSKHTTRLRIPLAGILFISFILITGHCIAAPRVKLDYIGLLKFRNGKPMKDTDKFFDILGKFDWEKRFDWDIKIIRNGRQIELHTSKADTVNFEKPDTLIFSTTFMVDTQLVDKIISLHYDLDGSIIFKINGETILQTGIFVKNIKNKYSNTWQNNYLDLIFKDTTVQIEFNYVPDPYTKLVNFNLDLEDRKYAESKLDKKLSDAKESFAIGFYYLSFGIIFFIFFLFFRDKTENLYFSLFCVFSALAALWTSLKLHILDDGQHLVWMVLAFEFLSLFFAKMLRNTDKSKIPLTIILVVFAISFLPFIKYYPVSISGQKVPLIPFILNGVLICYAVFSSVYYLFSGFGQKRWEARAIVYMVCGATLLMIVPSFIIGMLKGYTEDPTYDNNVYVDFISSFGSFLYPLSAAIVLGRRNGLNQKKLIKQLKSIEQLSDANLAKEKEKQQILESQNTELERRVNERTQEVMHQKEIIEIKNKSITDNLTYAQRIQSAILPDIKLIYKTLEQSFILYLPKDIVSGDFYAFAERNGNVLIIAGDCTGHGVSGAFMSMIGSSLMNQIINERGINEPAAILKQLNTAIIDALKQNENDSHDGMDVSICSINMASRELQYAGANRPLWILRNSEIQVVRPDKFPIGGLQSAIDPTFTNHLIQLKKDDSIYIFTDGYADQFGGERGKKLMTSKFKDVLLSIRDMDMRKQENYLKEYFDSWKGENEQVDDVLVIGVRV